MIGIEFSLISGRYHATPWQRHVNEADVEWPPSSWRVLRALIAVWYRKGVYLEYSEKELHGLVQALCTEFPVYVLPESSHSNSRHYMPIASGKKALVYDGFLATETGAVIEMVWPSIDLAKTQETLLSTLVHRLGYLGRAESWVEARVIHQLSRNANCFPLESTHQVNVAQRASEDIVNFESVTVLTPISSKEYEGWRNSEITQLPPSPKRGRYQQQEELPKTIFGALVVDTNVLQANGRLVPPGSRWVLYSRPKLDSRTARTRQVNETVESNAVSYALTSKPQPSVSESLDIADIVHLALLDKFEGDAPTVISGREKNGEVSARGHRHLFILPGDEDGDGHIDHVLIHSPDGLSPEVLAAMTRLHELHTPSWWSGRSRQWQVFLEGTFQLDEAMAEDAELPKSMRKATKWVSQTPYWHPWHVKRNGKFGPEQQIRKELRLRGLPDPIHIEQIPPPKTLGKVLQSHEFRRFRRVKRQRLPDRLGGFWMIEFPEAVRGPLALGSNCHFGMGMFVPYL